MAARCRPARRHRVAPSPTISTIFEQSGLDVAALVVAAILGEPRAVANVFLAETSSRTFARRRSTAPDQKATSRRAASAAAARRSPSESPARGSPTMRLIPEVPAAIDCAISVSNMTKSMGCQVGSMRPAC